MEKTVSRGTTALFPDLFPCLWYLPVAAAVAGLTVYAFLKSITYQLYDELDRQITTREHTLALLAGTVLILLFLKLWTSRIAPKLPPAAHPLLPLAVCCIVSVYLIVAVRGLAVNDALTMDGITNRFMQGDYSDFTSPGGYLYNKSHQIGYLVYETLIYRLFGASNFRAYQVVNLFCILITVWLLTCIARELFESRRVYHLTCIMSCGLLFLFVYSTHIYNDIVSLPFQTAAMYLQLRYLRTGRILRELLAGVCLAVGYLLKTNVLISLVAMVFLLAQEAIRRFRNTPGKRLHALQPVLLAISLVALSLGLTAAVRSHYTHLAGLDVFPPGEPMSTYVAMSLQETQEGQSGWYNGYNARVFKEHDYDYALTDAAAKKEIQTRLASFLEDPAHGVYFFAKKFLTQWADASCISMRNLELASRHVEGHSTLIHSIIYDRGRSVFYGIMKLFFVIYCLGFLIYLTDAIRKRQFPAAQSLFILFIFGGMLFHEFWEASSRYTMRYYLFFVPFAAYGIDRIIQGRRV